MNHRVDYDRIAPDYDRRFSGRRLADRGQALLDQAGKLAAKRILEVGCGTGHWWSVMKPTDRALFGLDLSLGMLNRARTRNLSLRLVQGQAGEPPFGDNAFDMVFCVNAIHHFEIHSQQRRKTKCPTSSAFESKPRPGKTSMNPMLPSRETWLPVFRCPTYTARTPCVSPTSAGKSPWP